MGKEGQSRGERQDGGKVMSMGLTQERLRQGTQQELLHPSRIASPSRQNKVVIKSISSWRGQENGHEPSAVVGESILQRQPSCEAALRTTQSPASSAHASWALATPWEHTSLSLCRTGQGHAQRGLIPPGGKGAGRGC